MGIAVQASSLLPLVNEVETYTLTVTNRGPDSATGVKVINRLPIGSLVLGVQSQTGSYQVTGYNLNWTIASLAAKGGAVLQFRISLPLLGSADDNATVSADEIDSNPADNSASSSVTTLLGGLPQILSQPAGKNVLVGTPVQLDINASSASPMHYQWRLNGINLPGATNSVLAFPAFQQAQSGAYSVQVINDVGVVSSEPAQLIPALSVGLPFADNFADRQTVSGLSVVGIGDNLTATIETGEPQHGGRVVGKTVWLTWHALLGGVTTISTTGSTFDTVLAVYTGSSLDSLTQVAADDDSGGFHTSLVTFNAVAGQDYQIAVGGYDGAAGIISLILGCDVTGGQVPVINTHPLGQTVAPGATVTLNVQASGTGLSFQWLRNGVEVPGATNPQLTLSSVGFPEVGVYQVRVGNATRSVLSKPASIQMFIPGPGEPFVDVRAEDKLSDVVLSLLGLLPVQQNLITGTATSTTTSARYSITTKSSKTGSGGVTAKSTARGYTGTHVFSTYGSGSQQGEPNPCDDPGGASEWVGYQPPEDGVLTLDTDGSDFDTILAVYTGDGSSFETLQPVACDDNSGANGITSKVVFDVHGNSTYFISVDGVNGTSGTVVLNYNLMVPPAVTMLSTNQIVPVGSTVQLAAIFSGRPVPFLQWQLNGQNIADATNANLQVDSLCGDQEGAYQLTASNPLGLVVSDPRSVLIDAPLKLESMDVDITKKAKFKLVGLHSNTFLIQASTNLVDWLTIATNYTDSGILSYVDSNSTNQPCRFYRAVPQ